jgi:hypothetical protein
VTKRDRSIERTLARLLEREPAMARKDERQQLQVLLGRWRPIHCRDGNKVGELVRLNGEIIERFEWDRLRAALPLQDFVALRVLFSMLAEQAAVAHWACAVAAQVLQSQAGRKLGGKTTAERLKADSARRAKVLKAGAKKILALNPRLSAADIARRMSERGHGNADGIRKKLTGGRRR